ncbi:zinc ribbon domain-containing protein [Micromonospora sp. CB01531]|uniref:zinc ribbon domain-containing protein n=1 Tax=Micromonospora sp. CB01531 TaxID=1718947 RepID=UPI0009FB8E35
MVVIDRWYPASKLCLACGSPRRADAADHAVVDVPGAASTHHRNVNAAYNILAAGLAVTTSGAGARPQRETSRTGQPAMQ